MSPFRKGHPCSASGIAEKCFRVAQNLKGREKTHHFFFSAVLHNRAEKGLKRKKVLIVHW